MNVRSPTSSRTGRSSAWRKGVTAAPATTSALIRRDQEREEKIRRLQVAFAPGCGHAPGRLMRLRLSRLAQADLDDIRDYGVARFGVDRGFV